MTLTEFLLARIAEDEDIARDAAAMGAAALGAFVPEHVVGATDHGVTSSPARVLAECEAKRRIVQPYKSGGGEYGAGYDAAFEDVLSLLALPYAEHPDYREEWGL